MPTYPTLSTGTTLIASLKQSLCSPVRVKQFAGGQVQRWRVAAAYLRFEISHVKLRWADVITLRNFWDAQGLAGPWSLPVGAATYNNCVFSDKLFTAQEQQRGLVNVSLKARQVLPESTVAHPTIGGTQPSFPAGLVQAPYNSAKRRNAIVSDRETGPRYEYDYDAASLIAFDVTLNALTQTERDSLVAFFASVGGPWAPFNFTDPDTATVYTHIFFSMDELAVEKLASNVYRSAFTLVENR